MKKVWMWAFGVPFLVLGMVMVSFSGGADRTLAQASSTTPVHGR
jgi:hypothetical protein